MTETKPERIIHLIDGKVYSNDKYNNIMSIVKSVQGCYTDTTYGFYGERVTTTCQKTFDEALTTV